MHRKKINKVLIEILSFALIIICNSASLCFPEESYIERLENWRDKEGVMKARQELISMQEKAMPIIKEALSYREWNVRYEAVKTLDGIHSEESTRLLLEAIYNNKEEAIKVAAMDGLRKRTLPEEDLLKLLEDENITVQSMAVDRLEGHPLNLKIFSILEKQFTTLDVNRKDRYYGAIEFRAKIARLLGKDRSLKSDIKADLLLKALKIEVKEPISQEPRGYTTSTEYLKRQYLFALEDLEDSVIQVLKKELTAAGGGYRDRIIIALGCKKDSSVFNQLIGILTNSKDGFIRADAAYALGKLGNKEATPFLEKALNDSFVRDIHSSITEPGIENIIYPVREEAFCALRKLGINVRREGNKFSIQ